MQMKIALAHSPESFRDSRLIPDSSYSLTNRLDLKKIFGRRALLHVDLGCGDGSFLCALAQRLPDKNFLGIERLSGRFKALRVKPPVWRMCGFADGELLRGALFVAR